MKKPPYEITDTIVNLVADISAMLPVLLPKVSMQLRKECNVRSIHSSLAIENNSLSLEQVSDIVNGRRVIGPPSEIQEVKNAYNAYSQIETFQPYSVVDFCKAHKLMMKDLVTNPGEFRHQGVGVYAGNVLIHAAPKAEYVHGHMKNLFDWAKSSDVHPLIKSSVVHYEIEFIHPFLDGNGRMGRLWQTVILSNWDSLFLSLPTETIVFKKQHDYYAVLAESDKEGSSTTFIEFMLLAIADSIALQEKHQDKHIDKHQVDIISKEMLFVLNALKDKELSRKDIFLAIGKSSDYRAFKRYIQPLLEGGYMEMTIPDKPTSRSQKYRLTNKGKESLGQKLQ